MFLSVLNLGATFKTYVIMQRCKERTCVLKKKRCAMAKQNLCIFSLAVSHTSKVIQDQNKPYKITNVSLKHMLKM